MSSWNKGCWEDDARRDGITQQAELVKDHKFEPQNPSNPWGKCKFCALYEAAHKFTAQDFRAIIVKNHSPEGRDGKASSNSAY